jgi:hypothetical protein
MIDACIFPRQPTKEDGTLWACYNHADFRHPPVIEDIDLSAYAGLPGQLIRVRAVDDFGVVRIAIASPRWGERCLNRATPSGSRTCRLGHMPLKRLLPWARPWS